MKNIEQATKIRALTELELTEVSGGGWRDRAWSVAKWYGRTSEKVLKYQLAVAALALTALKGTGSLNR